MTGADDRLRRIHVLGASGSGTTTFGRAWAARFGHAHLDTDEVYWLETDPPFTEKRPVAERFALLAPAMAEAERVRGWILTGSLCGWGDPLIPRFELVVFLFTPPELRLRRLLERERERYGEAIAPGGPMRAIHDNFLAWAARYDTAGHEQRSLRLHEDWLAGLRAPVVRVSGLDSTERQIDQVLAAWRARSETG